jgi:hypothetical protein
MLAKARKLHKESPALGPLTLSSFAPGFFCACLFLRSAGEEKLSEYVKGVVER